MREPVNTWTHFVTFLAGLVGLIFLILLSHYSPSKLITMTIYGVSVIMLYGASTVYHWVKTTPNKFGFHEVFHIFTSLGSVLHFIMIRRFILPI